MEFYSTPLVKFSYSFIHMWGTWGQRYRVPKAQKIHLRVTILCLFFKFLAFWCRLATLVITKVSCGFMFYTSSPIFIPLGHIGPVHLKDELSFWDE